VGREMRADPETVGYDGELIMGTLRTTSEKDLVLTMGIKLALVRGRGEDLLGTKCHSEAFSLCHDRCSLIHCGPPKPQR
jgi:hypothetical protein